MKTIKAGLKNLNEVVSLEKQIFPADGFSKKAYRYLIKKGWVFIICYKGKIAGHGCIVINKFRNGKSKGRIYSVGILEKYRGRGLASTLIKHMEKACGDVEYITLETHKSHKNVIRLYEKMGYEITEQLPDYYEYGDSSGDGVRMRKNLLKHLPDISYKTIPQKDMRFRDAGDWWDSKKGWEIRVPRLMNMDYEFLIFIHEAIERYLIHKQGFSVSHVDNWIKENLKDSYKKGAMTKGAPQRSAHIFATQIEKQICAHLGVSWRKYDRELDEYVNNLFKENGDRN